MVKPLSQLTPARSARLIKLERAGNHGVVPAFDEVAAYAALSTLGWADREGAANAPCRFTLSDKGRAVLTAAKKGPAT